MTEGNLLCIFERFEAWRADRLGSLIREDDEEQGSSIVEDGLG